MSATAEIVEPSAAASIHLRTLALCIVAATVEGYDTQVIGYVVPVVSKAWALPPSAFGPTLSAGLAGLMLGCLVIAPLADRVGRKWIIVGSTLAYAGLILATATATSLNALFWLRFLTGVGIGGGLPNIAAIAADVSSAKWRATAVASLFIGFGLGGFFGGVVAAWLIALHGWQSVFLFGGAVSLLLVPLLAIALPNPRPHAKAGGNPVTGLFLDGRVRATLALWLVNFMGLMDLYLLASWLPTTLNGQGISIPVAALIAGFLQVAGAVGALTLGPIVDRYGPTPALPAAYLLAALSIAAIGLAGGSVVLSMLAVFGAGFGIVGCQDCNSGVAAKLYPAEIRSTGVGWALGIGRIGSIIGPLVVAELLSAGLGNRAIFLFSAVPAVFAAAAYLAMGRRPEFTTRA